MRVLSRHIQETLEKIEKYLLQEYKENKEETKRDWRTYEQKLAYRIKTAIRRLEPLIDEATSAIKIQRGQGRKPELTLKQKVTLILLKELFDKSNRNMAFMMDVFSLLSGIDVGYKTVERLYSDPEVEMALLNLHALILRKKGIKEINASGDGTGYSLTIKRHYASEAEKRKDKAKESGAKMAFVYSFKLLDLGTRMYVAYGMSFRSEKQAFEGAMEMLKGIDVKLKSIRLDRYYSFPSYIDRFGNAMVYVIPRSNATLKGSLKWKKTMIRFVLDTMNYLGQYYMRNNSEAEIGVDKRWFGWGMEQRREDRICTAHACGVVWHNLFNLYG